MGRTAARATRSSPRSRTANSGSARSTTTSRSWSPGGLYVDVKCQADAGALRARGVQRLEAVMTGSDAAADSLAVVRRRLQRTTAALARHRQRRLHRLAPARGAAAARAGRGQPRQLRDRPSPQSRGSARRRRRGSVATPHASSRPTSPTPPPAAAPAPASTSSCTRPRSARCRARSRIRCARTRPTRPASSTCWSRRAMPASRASSTRVELDLWRPPGPAQGRGRRSAARCRPTR